MNESVKLSNKDNESGKLTPMAGVNRVALSIIKS
jgi:hypothetical protein